MKTSLLLLTLLTHQGSGKEILQLNIVGGESSAPGEWPWQVSLQINGNAHCGGSLITDFWVLTAAHCFEMPLDTSVYTIYLGAYQLSDLQNPETESRTVEQIIVHPNFTNEGSSGDIALVKLENPVNFTTSIRPVHLPSEAVRLPQGTLCWVTGWGSVEENVPLTAPKTLQKVEVALIDNGRCKTMYQSTLSYSYIQEDMICAGYQEGKKDSCQGDSGGPLVCKRNGVWLQLGITSWGTGCAMANRPGVYTRVQHYQSWLGHYVPGLQYSDGGQHFTSKKKMTSENAFEIPGHRKPEDSVH